MNLAHCIKQAIQNKPTYYQQVDEFITSNNLSEVAKDLSLTHEEIILIHKKFFLDVQTRRDVLSFEQEIKDMDTAYSECPYEIFHSFADGMYTREIHIKKGDFIVGAIHKNEYFVNVLKGRIWVVSEFGAKEIIAPASFTAKAGVKHIGFTLEDTVWCDTHKVTTNNIEEAEKELFADSYEELDEYQGLLADINMSSNEVRAISEIELDVIQNPAEDKIIVKDSSIEGKGVFADKDFLAGEKIGSARVGKSRTLIGRYTNHSNSPNAGCAVKGEIGFIYALSEIKRGQEITIDYRESVKLASVLDAGEISCQVG